MRLEEIQNYDAAEARIKRMKDTAATAKQRAKTLKQQADMSAERLTQQKSRQKLTQLQRRTATPSIKPYT